MQTFSSPAKINLFLRIIKRRPDGYHELASLLQAISLTDTLKLALADEDHLTCNDQTIPTDHSNLIFKAADLFRRKTGKKFGLKVHLEKRIPHQAGLGGGSGNAATTLWALNQLWHQPASETDLAIWSSEIGSDIPFFFTQGTAYCTGRGEIMREVAIPESNMWIVKPSQGLSTPEVYRNLDVSTLELRDPEHYLKDVISGNHSYFNDLEMPALRLFPALAQFKNKLISFGFHTVVMTGSGSAFFCIGDATPPPMDGVFSAPISFLKRASGAWY